MLTNFTIVKSYDLLIFDVDGTLVENYNSDQLLPRAIKYFSELSKPGPSIALATNQGGVGLRYWMEKESFGQPERFPTQIQARSRILKIAGQIAELYIYPYVYIAWAYQSKSSGKWGPVPEDSQDDPEWSSNFRKPNSGMIIRAIDICQTIPDRTLVIGDQKTDWEAGDVVGCDTIEADIFFGETG